jgi:pyruvate dehydrogenase E1 component
MLRTKEEIPAHVRAQETDEWIEALDQIIDQAGPDRAREILQALVNRASNSGVTSPVKPVLPYVNTISVDEEVAYPGDREMERRIKSIIRWNAVAMVLRANKNDDGIGGHLSTYASLATLTEVAFDHFFRGSYGSEAGDFIYYQGHASPGVYARAFLEGRLTEAHLHNFRHELRDHPGLSSYPHPWLMPDFWSFPTVSMGLGPINSIYQARFMKYLENRGLIPVTGRKVYAFIGDGESDEPETLGAIRIASSEKLDNLVWVVNCNLQRLDGPVRGNGSVVRELEGVFRGAGWNVIKVLWGSDWDELFARDKTGLLLKRMEECVDGEYQNFKARGGAYVRKEFFGKYPELLELVADKTDEHLGRLRRGGHDPKKVYNAYKRAMETTGQPAVILAKTVKGYGLGGQAEGKNLAHNAKSGKQIDLSQLITRFNLPISDEAAQAYDLYHPGPDSPEIRYMKSRREALGGFLPSRKVKPTGLVAPALDSPSFSDSFKGSLGREVMHTATFLAVLRQLLKDKELGKYIVPIVPDEARTFGMEGMIGSVGIYASMGQLYEPADSVGNALTYYKESKTGQILEEGITEAGAMAEFTAAGTAYANYGVPMIPFYIYYSMFGFQRIGDMVWAFADSRGKGFLLGGTAGRTTLNGEGLQHEDGHSLVLSSTVPTCLSYDPAYAYEIAVIVQDGIRRMYQENEDVFYYITLYNEFYAMPPMPEGVNTDGILKGLYLYQKAQHPAVAQLFGSGPILNAAVKAAGILAEKYDVHCNVWSATSYNNLRRDCMEVERWNRLHPESAPRYSYLSSALEGHGGPIIASSDYMKIVPDQIAPWLPNRLVTLGTDGFGRSENRGFLRKFFEIDAEAIVAATLSTLARQGKFDAARAAQAMRDLGINTEAPNPATL